MTLFIIIICVYSKDIGHLLKAPFCVHEATGNVCIPLPPSLLKSFDPSTAPNVSTLRTEYIQGKSDGHVLYIMINPHDYHLSQEKMLAKRR